MRTGFIVADGGQNCKPFINQPLGVLYLQTIIDKEFGDKLNSSVIDLRGTNDVIIPEKDIYFYSVTSPDYADIKNIVGEIRKTYPKAKHIAGGTHINIFPQESLKTFDTISLGEGEDSIITIIKDSLNGGLKKVYKQENRIDINAYPFPLRKYLPSSVIAVKGKINKKHEELKGTDVMFSRGCPFSCYFCANLNPNKTRFRSPQSISEEINYLKREYHIEALAIKDDQSIPVDVGLARPALEAIARTNIKWRGQSRANGVHPDMVRLAKEAGCVEVAVGIESISQEVLKIINKRIDFHKAKEYLGLLKKEGIDTKLLLIIGLPGEPENITDITIEFIKEIEPTNVLLSLFCPMPGSMIYEFPEKFGIRLRNGGFDKLRTTFGRFDEKEEPELTFDYEEGITSSQIINNYMKVQSFLRKNNFNY